MGRENTGGLDGMLIALDNGFQACAMAPTEILANQHYDTIKELLFGMDKSKLRQVRWRKKREAILWWDSLTEMYIYWSVPTPLLKNTVKFCFFRIGCNWRTTPLWCVDSVPDWSKSIQPPHVLVMTVTPIPRTLAMTLYGDLDVSVIDELPPDVSRSLLFTSLITGEKSLYRSVRKQIEEGARFILYIPWLRRVKDWFEKSWRRVFAYFRGVSEFDCKVCKVHGKWNLEKDAQMQLLFRVKCRLWWLLQWLK